MGKVNEIKGNLITLAKEGKFDAIVQGNNCFCVQGAGLAPQMVKAFGTDTFPKEREAYKGDINKLGTIDYEIYPTNELGKGMIHAGKKTLPSALVNLLNKQVEKPVVEGIAIINSYTQYGFGRNHEGGTEAPVDYQAIQLVFKKINHIFKGKHIGVPQIGSGLAGGKWSIIKKLIIGELTDCDVTLVEYDGSR